MSERLRIVGRQGHPDFLDLPWHTELASWTHPRLATVARGVARHVVRFVRYGDRVYALKETGSGAAHREYRLLRRLRDDEGLPTVEAVGVVDGRRGRDGEPLGAVLITLHLDYSLPYRYLFRLDQSDGQRRRLIDALVVLLVRLHLAGFFWGDCSLSNTLFRRDAGALAAYLVDAETGEFHPTLTDELRHHELEIARTNIAGGLYDMQAEGRLPLEVDPVSVVDELEERYHGLWNELTRTDELDPAERWRIEERIRTINELGFDVEELTLERSADGTRIWVRPAVVEEGHHHRLLRRLTGLEVQENQARRLLGAIHAYGAWLSAREGRELPEAVVAYRWLSERFEPVVAAVPETLRDRLEPAEIYLALLEHRGRLAERHGREVDNDEALVSFLAELPARPPERLLDVDELADTGVGEPVDGDSS